MISPASVKFLRVRRWHQDHENNESRKLTSLRWLRVNITLSDPRFLLLLSSGADVYGAWVLLLQVAAANPNKNYRGYFVAEDGSPYDVEMLSMMTRISKELVEKTIDIATEARIGLLEYCDSLDGDSETGESPDAPGDSPGRIDQKTKSRKKRIEKNGKDLGEVDAEGKDVCGLNNQDKRQVAVVSRSEYKLLPAIPGVDKAELAESIGAFLNLKERPSTKLLRMAITGSPHGVIHAKDIQDIPRCYSEGVAFVFIAVADVLRRIHKKSVEEIVGALRLLESDDYFAKHRNPALPTDELESRRKRRKEALSKSLL